MTVATQIAEAYEAAQERFVEKTHHAIGYFRGLVGGLRDHEIQVDVSKRIFCEALTQYQRLKKVDNTLRTMRNPNYRKEAQKAVDEALDRASVIWPGWDCFRRKEIHYFVIILSQHVVNGRLLDRYLLNGVSVISSATLRMNDETMKEFNALRDAKERDIAMQVEGDNGHIERCFPS